MWSSGERNKKSNEAMKQGSNEKGRHRTERDEVFSPLFVFPQRNIRLLGFDLA
jgi:hypothetical protein